MLSEPMCRLGAKVTGIDASDKNIKVAKLHSKKNNLQIDYFCSSPEKFDAKDIDHIVFAGMGGSGSIGDTIAVTIITVAGNASHYVDSLAIDGKNTGITTHWVGGSTPSDGGASAVDIYAFNILKTASETYTVVANHTKCSS